MNTLFQKLFAYIKTHPYRTFFGLLSVLAVIGLALRLLYPPEPSRKTRLVLKPSQFATVQTSNPIQLVSLATQQLPPQTEAAVYSVDNYIPDNKLLVHIAATLKLDPALYSKYAYGSRDNAITIMMNDALKTVEYNSTQNQPTTAYVTLAEATQRAMAFFTDVKFSVEQFHLDESLTAYWSSGIEPTQTSPDTAASITLFFRRSQDNIPIALGATPANSLIVHVSSKGVFKATIPTLFFSQTKRETAPLISVTKAVSQVQSGNYFILGQINNPLTYDHITARITNFNVTEVKLEYRLDEEQQLLLPFYRLTGMARFENGIDNIPVMLITPAYTPSE